MLTFTTSALTTFIKYFILDLPMIIDSIHQERRNICILCTLSARIGYRNVFIVSIYLVAKLVRNRKKVVRKSNLEDK